MRGLIQRFSIGASVEGRGIYVHVNFDPSDRDALTGETGTLLIGGTHGDERATVDLLEAFAADAASGSASGPTAVLALHNPDGHAADIRYNARGVDLNRNFPHRWTAGSEEPAGPSPLSEPEARALHDFILERRPRKIVSLHWALAELDADGPQSAGLASAMWDALSPGEKRPYRLVLPRQGASAAGFCPGSLGQWAGHSLVYPGGLRPAMVTLELPYHAGDLPRPDPLPEGHFEDVRALWRARRGEYLAAVGGPVLRMLRAACLAPHPRTGSGGAVA